MRKFFADESGATAVEYGIVVALIAGAIILALAALGTSLNDMFGYMAGKVQSARPGG